MDRGVVHVLEDEEEDKKPIIRGPVASGDHARSMDFVGVSSSTSVGTFQPHQSSGAMAHNLQSFSQISGVSSQEKLEASASSTLQHPLQQPLMLQQQGGSQQSDKGPSPNLNKRPGAPSQAISFGTLMPMLLPNLPPDKAQKLNALYLKLKKSELTKEDFLRATRMLVGDQILVATVKQMQVKQQLQAQMPRPQSSAGIPPQLPFQQQMQHPQQQQQQHQPQPQQQQLQPQQQQLHPQQQQQQSQLTKSSLEQLQQHRTPTLQAQETGQFHSQQPMPPMQSTMETSMHYQANSRVAAVSTLQSDYRQDQWHQGPSASSSLSLQQLKHEMDKSQVSEFASGPGGAAVSTHSNLNAQSGISSLMPSTVAVPPARLSIPDGVTSLPIAAAGNQVRTPPKRAASDQRKSADVSPVTQGKSKKQKVGGDDLEQSIDQLNDVTAVSGVNLREEEENLLTGPKEESQSTQAMRRFAQEEEGRLFLDRGPLRLKVNAIASKHGVSNVSEEAEQCLSMCVEERLRNMLYKLAKVSSRRCDQEKEMHKVLVTSDIQKQIVLIRKKAKEAFDKKQAIESERLRKINEVKEKASQNEGASKEDGTASQKKEKKKGEEGKQKASAASMAARSANDMLLKWQMMAEQGRQKREGESGASATNDTNAVNSVGAIAMNNRELDRKQGSLEAKQVVGRTTTAEGGGLGTTGQGPLKKAPGDGGISRALSQQTGHLNQPPAKPICPITAKDVVAYLETEPQMAKSPLIYHFYEKNLASSQAV